ncbi:hypothetical protein JHK82_022625 [Glycine max]|nr:hypothetical protein JHK85_023116 [Glycine max]KAG5026732.1 hypothetical protein JHK86_022646 [Glycine max]KAG5137894.1 hypothetical protein JHK82_022625 [Glycine max]
MRDAIWLRVHFKLISKGKVSFCVEHAAAVVSSIIHQHADHHCLKWGFEKLVYRDSTTNIRRNKKYAVQPRSLYATGVHFSQHLAGKTYKTEDRMKYFHYHGIIAKRRESCKIFATSTQVTQAKITYVIDTTMRDIARVIKKFEFKMIGSRLEKTRQ